MNPTEVVMAVRYHAVWGSLGRSAGEAKGDGHGDVLEGDHGQLG
jgi:hypothetical protein